MVLRSWIKFKLGIAIFSTYSILKQVTAQTYIMTCNDPFLVGHQMAVGGDHTYCDHACDPNPRGPSNVCNAAGMCLCTPACYNGPVAPPPPQALGGDYCPLAGGPFQNPNDEADCQAMCAGACTGGFGGQLCKENEAADDPMRRFRVCTCLCPAQPCVVPTIPPVIPPIALPGSNGNFIPIPVFLLKKIFKKIFLVLKKMYLLCWILLKIYVLKVFIIFCLKEMAAYYFGVHLDIDYADIHRIFTFVKWFL